MTKQEIRKQIAVERQALDPEWRMTASADIVERLVLLPSFESAEFVGLYLAIEGEVVLDELLSECWARGKRTAIPVFNTTDQLYEMAEITSGTLFATGHYGIREPIAPAPIAMSDLDLIAVPGVAFDRLGNRLGRGGGYYDRLLTGFEGSATAVAFDFQVVDRVPVDELDRPVQLILTEKEVLEVSNER